MPKKALGPPITLGSAPAYAPAMLLRPRTALIFALVMIVSALKDLAEVAAAGAGAAAEGVEGEP